MDPKVYAHMIYDKSEMTIHPSLPKKGCSQVTELSELKLGKFQANWDELITLSKSGTLEL